MTPGTVYELTYLDGVRFVLKEIKRTEGTKKLSRPQYKFQYVDSIKTFSTYLEDVERAIRFKRWKEVKIRQ